MESVLKLMAGQFVDNYPIEIIEEISKKCLKRIKKESHREVAIRFSRTVDITRQDLLNYCCCLRDMNIFQMAYDANDWFDFIRHVRRLMINSQEKASISILIDLLKNEQISKKTIRDIYDLLYINDYMFDQNDSKQIIGLLNQYSDHRKYFTIESCYKGDYVAIYRNLYDNYETHEIKDNISELNLMSSDHNNIYILYQVD